MKIHHVLVALLAGSGCSSQIQRIRELSIESPAIPEADGPPVPVLLCRFEDLRGDRYHRVAAANVIPVVNFVYSGATHYHPDRTGLDGGSRRGRTQVAVGPLDTALPDLLAATIRRARPSWPIEVTASRDRCRSGGDAAIVIDGAVRRTDLTTHTNFVPLGLLSPLGAPIGFIDFVGELDVRVRRADTGALAWEHTFRIDERRAVGFYYNRQSAYDMLTSLVRETVQETTSGAIHVAERAPPP